MLVRLYTENDAPALGTYLAPPRPPSAIDPSRDTIVLGIRDGYISGVVAGAPTLLVHHLSTNSQMLARLDAAEMVQFGIGVLAGRGVRRFTFLIRSSNVSMLRFMKELGAKQLPDDIKVFQVTL